MSGRFKISAAAVALLGVTALGCAGRNYNAGDGTGGSGSGSGGSGSNSGTGGGSNSGTGGNGSGSGTDGGSNDGAGGSGTASLLQTDVRRLTNAEYDSSVQALFGTKLTPAASTFAADSTQSGYTLNEAQVVASQMAKDLDTAAIALVTEARGNGKLAALSPCTDPTNQGATCAATFVTSFGAQVYRRPVTTDEASNLATVYQAAITGDTGSSPYNDGIDLITRTMLQSPGFLYVTELGPNPPSADLSVTLTPYEMASTMSYLLTAGPPDATLMAAAAAGNLSTPDQLETQARRLLASAGSPTRLVRLVREWLGIDSVGQIAKDMNWYPDFASLNAAAMMDDETTSFINEVLQKDTGTVSELLGAPWTIINPTSTITASAISNYYSKLYGVTGSSGETSLASAKGGARVGILNQGAFSSVYAHASTSAPVLRGVAILRRVTCIGVPDPATLMITVPPPPAPDASNPETTRALFNVHGTTVGCTQCHTHIDAFGFTFEGYDGMGEYRTIDADSSGTVHLGAEKVASTRSQAIGGYEYLPIDTTSGAITGTNTDLDGSYSDSNALATTLAASPTVASCLATQLFRGSTGRSDATGVLTASETAFQTFWSQLSSDKQGNFAEILVAYIRSPLFSQRSTM
jgi:hypothetical protein